MTATLPVFGFLKDRADDVAKSASMLKRVRLSGPFLSAEEPLSKRARSFRRRTTPYLRYALPRKKKLQAAGAMKSAIVDRPESCRRRNRQVDEGALLRQRLAVKDSASERNFIGGVC
jgi:hypothetical protein